MNRVLEPEESEEIENYLESFRDVSTRDFDFISYSLSHIVKIRDGKITNIREKLLGVCINYMNM